MQREILPLRTFEQILNLLIPFRVAKSGIEFCKNNFRYFEKGFIYLEGGGKEIRDFNITASANSGLTGAEVYPIYTNLSEGFGIVTAKNLSKMGNIQMSEQTIDSMFYHPLTQGLKFRL